MNVTFGVNRHVEQSVTQSFGFQASSLGFPNFVDGIAPSFPHSSRKAIPFWRANGLDN